MGRGEFGGPALTRRTFLAAAAAAGAGLATADLLAACAFGSATSKGTAANTFGKLAGVLPDYVPAGFVKPDLPPVAGSPPAYVKWPAKYVQAVKAAPVTSGGTVTAMTPAWWAIPPSQNAYYDAVNKRLGGDVTFSIVNGNDYGTKIAAVLAGKQLPDMTVVPTWNYPPGFQGAVESLFADLSDHVKGSAIRKWPFLANLPTGAWAYGAFNGRLYGIPFPNGLFGTAAFYRKDIFDQLGLAPPKTADELYKLGKTITNPSANRWAFAGMYEEVLRIFGIPNQDFRVESNGSLTYFVETPEYEAAIAFLASIYKAGFVHPTAIASPGVQDKQLFEAGRALMYKDGVGSWHEALERNRPTNPSFNMQAWPIFSHDGRAKPYVAVQNAVGGIYCFLNKNLSSQRIDELLGVANFCSATIGTEEYNLILYGVQGVHWTPGAGGVPQPTDLGKRDVTYTYGFLSGRPDFISEPQYPDYVRDNYKWQATSAALAVKGPFYALNVQEPDNISPYKPKGLDAQNGIPFDNAMTDIVHGRAPVSSLKAAVQSWRQSGGDQYKAFYADILAQQKKS
jgi:putative aldouronate transport system substrate-binding protein